jgi:hypothetical protein
MPEVNTVTAIDEPTTTPKPLSDEDDLIQRVLSDIEKRGLVGEEDNAAIAFLCAISARRPEPLHLTVSGESSSGKNFLLAKVADFIPEEHKKFLTGMTPKALMYAGEYEFQHKAIFIAEYEGVAKADYAIRTMQSEKLINWDFVDSSKGLKKISKSVKGPAAFLQATTRPVLHPENETRLLFVNVDESPAQTRAIMQRQAEAATKGAQPDDERTIQAWHNFLKELKTMNVFVPFAAELANHFPDNRVRSRRDFPKLLEMIKNSAFLHQHKRETNNGAVMAAPDDYILAKQLFERSYDAGPDSKVKELLDAAEALQREFRVSDLMEKTGWGKSKVYAVVSRAEELGCVAETETRGIYHFIRNSAVPPLELPNAI